MYKLKQNIKKVLLKVKYILRTTIPLYIDFILTNNSFKKKLKNNGIASLKEYKVKTWHLGYKYYTGYIDNEKVFIKYNKNYKWIEYEYNNFNYLNKSSYFKTLLPKVYSYIKLKKGSCIVIEFLNYNSISNCISNNININKEKIYGEFEKILIESQNINFKFLDLNPSNIFIDENNNLYLIDLGFSNLTKDNISFIDNMHIRSLIINNLNDFSRLDKGVIDDAYSIIQISKYIDPKFISNNYEYFKKFNDLMGINVFDKKELENEN